MFIAVTISFESHFHTLGSLTVIHLIVAYIIIRGNSFFILMITVLSE